VVDAARAPAGAVGASWVVRVSNSLRRWIKEALLPELDSEVRPGGAELRSTYEESPRDLLSWRSCATVCVSQVRESSTVEASPRFTTAFAAKTDTNIVARVDRVDVCQ
jgi:hypothetical protein